MEINYLFTNDYDYLNNFTTFIPKNQEKGVQVDTKNVKLALKEDFHKRNSKQN